MTESVYWTRPTGMVVVAIVLAPSIAYAQFEEPDTLPRFAVGPFVEITFRGTRAEIIESGEEVELQNGPAFGLHGEFRFSETLALAVAGSYAETEEKRPEAGQGGTGQLGFAERSLSQLVGQLVMRLKAGVPGYFVLGGGARFVGSVSGENQGGVLRKDSYSEPFALAGLGLELGSQRLVGRVDGRWYISAPAGQPSDLVDAKGLSSDFALGLSVLYKP